MSAAACSACYVSGYGIDGAACPCGCRPAPAIAPPVAAGSVDTTEFRDCVSKMFIDKDALQKLVVHINAWGAQQREAGFRDGLVDRLIGEVIVEDELRRRAEKAEFLLADALDTNARNVAFLTKAEARVKELETKVDELESSLEEIVHRGE